MSKEDTDWEVETIERKSVGMKRSQTVSDSAAEQKGLQRRERRHASTGVVCDSMLAMHPSGNACNSIVLLSPSISVSMFIRVLKLRSTETLFLFFKYLLYMCQFRDFDWFITCRQFLASTRLWLREIA